MGGIEKFNRAFMKAFLDCETNLNSEFTASGMYDAVGNENYIPSNRFSAFKGNRWYFVIKNLISSFKKDEIILGHVNLAMIGVLFKLLQPSKKITVICHGIEVFKPLTGLKKKLLQKADRLLAVSNYTKEQLINIQKVDAKKIHVFPNTLDPFFHLPNSFIKPNYLKERYGLKQDQKILFTLTRLNSDEGYKGYDKVIRALPALTKNGHQYKYIIGGKADAKESATVESLIASLGLQKEVLLAGYIPDSEVTDHYLLADVFVMPSKAEGFGIVYLEAMACGVPVIAGNKDGSTEAVQFGKLGTLIDPDSVQEIEMALHQVFQEETKPQQLQKQMLQYFSFEQYKKRLKEVFLK
jgi:glycosyltransferase involved in cell wall biosynthesis